MVKAKGENEVLRCSFCNKDQNDVRKLIAGPTVFICDECVEVCNDIIADDNRFDNRAVRSSLPVPSRRLAVRVVVALPFRLTSPCPVMADF